MAGGIFNQRNQGGRHGSRPSAGTESSQPEKKASTMEFTLHVAGKHQVATCDTVKDHMCMELQRDSDNGNNITSCSRAEKDSGMPELKPA